MEDPNPRVAGGGLAYLRAHGVTVDVGEGRAEAEALNRPFITVMRLGRPWVLAKVALSADGYVAAGPGLRTPLSGAAANRRTHLLRASVDGVGVGAGTVLADDPLLTCREVYRHRPLARVVFDRRLRTPATARVFGTLGAGPVYVVTGRVRGDEAARRAAALRAAGAVLIELDDPEMAPSLAALPAFAIQALLLEGGPTLHRAALAAGVVDAVRLVVTPRVLGPGGVPWVEPGVLSVPALDGLHVDPCGPDVIIEGHVHRTH
jgi:diaminohydroxyphosphoribosylaminopyrimidine deaminase/5-amino-6-(5-phosphoribosylamino)uracil reductase